MHFSQDVEHLADLVIKGELEMHRLDEALGNSNNAALVRRRVIEKKTGVLLTAISSTILDFEELVGRNIENPIGAVQIPLGIAGPLRVVGDYANGEYYVPLATTEGALVAGINRGCKAVNMGGGVHAAIIRNAMTRSPLFWTPSIGEARRLIAWVNEHLVEIRRVAESTTRHGRLLEVKPFITGNNVWLRFSYNTGDAMGMNMVTIATDKVCRYIEDNFPGAARYIALSGNMCSDKKPALINALCGRGKTVVAEAIVEREVALKVLKAEPSLIHEVNVRKNLLGSARAGSPAYNAHYANILAAIFIATGQDAAQIVESSLGYTWTELTEDGDLYISVTLPSLEIGTVGGGTRLPTQREALSIMGVAGGGDPPGVNAGRLAEIIAGAVLVGELNLLAALAAGHLAEAHRRLGRGLRVGPGKHSRGGRQH